MVAIRLSLYVSKEDISNGYSSSQYCPVAQALRRMGHNNPSVFEYPGTSWFDGQLWTVSSETTAWVMAYDLGEELEPFTAQFNREVESGDSV